MRLSLVLAASLGFFLWGAATTATEVDESAPNFSLPLLDADNGGVVSLTDYAGQIIYLDFWASWCPPCLVSMPIMNELRNRLQRQGFAFEVIAVNVDSDSEEALDFLIDTPVDFIVLADPEGIVPAKYEIKAMPTSFLISRDGIVRMTHIGFKLSDQEMIESEILELLEVSQ
jgi:thiol-disulfide isomerase/thioredoxin